MNSNPLKIFLVRHGQTAWTVSGQYTGFTDIELSVNGQAEAQNLRQLLSHYTFSYVFCSPLQRAVQTCAIAGLVEHACIRDEFSEWDNGRDEGRTPEQIQMLRPGWNFFRDGPDGGESIDAISQRADRCLTQFRQLEGNVVVFSHAHFCRVLAARWIHLPVWYAQHFVLDTASFGILSYEHEDISRESISFWNSAVLEKRN